MVGPNETLIGQGNPQLPQFNMSHEGPTAAAVHGDRGIGGLGAILDFAADWPALTDSDWLKDTTGYSSTANPNPNSLAGIFEKIGQYVKDNPTIAMAIGLGLIVMVASNHNRR